VRRVDSVVFGEVDFYKSYRGIEIALKHYNAVSMIKNCFDIQAWEILKFNVNELFALKIISEDQYDELQILLEEKPMLKNNTHIFCEVCNCLITDIEEYFFWDGICDNCECEDDESLVY